MHGITSCIHSILATCGTPVPGAVPPVARTAFSAWGRMHMTRFDDSYDSNPAENYERFFTTAIGRPLAEVLVERADVQPGERVLDVACGTGICARLVATTVGPKGAVAGLDANPAMLAVARQVRGIVRGDDGVAEKAGWAWLRRPGGVTSALRRG